ncbi:unnamed protein product [Gadus morhua 'NCC']
MRGREGAGCVVLLAAPRTGNTQPPAPGRAASFLLQRKIITSHTPRTDGVLRGQGTRHGGPVPLKGRGGLLGGPQAPFLQSQ